LYVNPATGFFLAGGILAGGIWMKRGIEGRENPNPQKKN
jgi:hypothetical protein